MDGSSHQINVKVKTISGLTFDFTVESYSTVLQFKEMIQEKTQLPIDNQKLIFLGKVLKDTQTLASCGTVF